MHSAHIHRWRRRRRRRRRKRNKKRRIYEKLQTPNQMEWFTIDFCCVQKQKIASDRNMLYIFLENRFDDFHATIEFSLGILKFLTPRVPFSLPPSSLSAPQQCEYNIPSGYKIHSLSLPLPLSLPLFLYFYLYFHHLFTYSSNKKSFKALTYPNPLY